MKIAMLGQKGIPAHSGGVEQHVDILSRELAARGHEVLVYCRGWYCGGELEPFQRANVRRIFTPGIATKHLDAITHTLTASIDVALRRADVVHYHALGPAALAPLARLARLPVVVTVHGLDWQRAKWGRFAKGCLRLAERVAARSANRLLVVSPTLCQHFAQLHHAEATFVANGVVPIPRREPDRMTEWGLKPKQYVLCVARLVPEKGLHYLIEAFTGTDLDMKLVIAGGGELNPGYEKQLKAMADQRVVFTGAAGRDLLAERYWNARLVVLPSDLEGMSIALLEAMSVGLPVLVSDIPQNGCVVESDEWTFRAGDVADLRQKMLELLNDPERLARNGKSASQRAEAWNWSSVADQLELIYAQCLEHANATGRERGASWPSTPANVLSKPADSSRPANEIEKAAH